MRAIRRHDLSPRVEMMPLIDVIFLLLTFFIYSLITMVRAEVLPVQLQPLTTGEAAKPAAIVAITIDQQGALYLNRLPVTDQTLDERLAQIGQSEDRPKLFLAMEDFDEQDSAQASVDRGPLLLRLIERVRDAGIEDLNFVGEKSPQ